jgi:mRNA-degrading endonuclease toxin of MazEF toxin-antitoxin module
MCQTENQQPLIPFGIYYADLGINVDSDGNRLNYSLTEGKRPVILLGNKLGLKHSPVVHVIPLSSCVEKALKKKLPVHVHIRRKVDFADKPHLKLDSIALVEQLTVIPKNLLRDYLGVLKQSKKVEIENVITLALGL